MQDDLFRKMPTNKKMGNMRELIKNSLNKKNEK